MDIKAIVRHVRLAIDEPLGQPLSLSAMGGPPQVVDHTEVQFLPYDAIVLGTGGIHLRNTGEFMKTCFNYKYLQT